MRTTLTIASKYRHDSIIGAVINPIHIPRIGEKIQIDDTKYTKVIDVIWRYYPDSTIIVVVTE